MENNQHQLLVSEPKREDFFFEIDYDLARIGYWFATKGQDHPLWNTMRIMESNLLCKVGMTIPE